MTPEQLKAWRDLATTRGLHALTATYWGRPNTVQGLRLTLVELDDGDLAVEVRIAPEGLGSESLDDWIIMPTDRCLRLELRLVTGDAAFDRSVAIFAPQPICVGLLDADMRRELNELVGDAGVVITEGAIRIPARRTAKLSGGQIAALVGRCEKLLKRFHVDEAKLRELILSRAESDPSETARSVLLGVIEADPELRGIVAKRRIAKARTRATEDSDAGLEGLAAIVEDRKLAVSERREALIALLDGHPIAAVAKIVAEQERLLGAIANEARGAGLVPVIEALDRALAKASPDSQTHVADDLVRRFWPYRPPGEPRALKLLLRIAAKAPRSTMVDLIREVLPGSDEGTFELALELLVGASQSSHATLAILGSAGLSRAHTLLPRIVRKLGEGGDLLVECFADVRMDLKVTYLDILGSLGDTRHERFVAGLLDSDPLPLQYAAIRALGECGTMKSLEALEPLTGGFFRAQELKQLAKAAVARIEERFANVQPGGLAVASPDGGLSIADADGGLALSTDARGSGESKEQKSRRK